MSAPYNSVGSNTFMTQKGELHLFVIWEHGRRKQDEIIRDIQEHLTILDCFDIQWDRDTVVKSFARLYGSDFKSGFQRYRACGGGRFLLITVWDAHPVYELTETLSGHEIVNINIFNLNKKYRGWVNRRQGNCIHSSTRSSEANHDLTLILGKNTTDYLNSVKHPWEGQVKPLNQNLLGAKGWKSMEETLYTLNNTVKYAVLRSSEKLLSHPQTEPPQGIDILTADREKILSILNPRSRFWKKTRDQVEVLAGNQRLAWNIRHVGDNYYCEDWQSDMLKKRVLSPHGFYCLDEENCFFSLVYHAHIHKCERVNSFESDSYCEKLRALFNRLRLEVPTDKSAFPCDSDLYFYLLRSFMKRKGYRFVRPLDPEVGYNSSVAKSENIAEQLMERYNLTDVVPIRVYYSNASSKWVKNWITKPALFFQGFLVGKKIFLKANGLMKEHKREYHRLLQCFQRNNRNFPEPLFYYESEKLRFVAIEWLEGKTFDQLLSKNRWSSSEKKSVILQMKDIAQTLYDAKIVHHDIGTWNFLVTPQGLVKCFDFMAAFEIKNYRKCGSVRKHSRFIRWLFRHMWAKKYAGDIACMLTILRRIGIEKEYEATYRHVETFLENLGEWNAAGITRRLPSFHRWFMKFFQVSLFVSEYVLPHGTWKTTLQHWLVKKGYGID